MNSNFTNLAKTSALPHASDAVGFLWSSETDGSLQGTVPFPNLSPGGEAAIPKPPTWATAATRSCPIQSRHLASEPWLARALCSRWESYRDRLDDCRKRPSSESVHQFRVATRRLAAQLFLLERIVQGRRPQKARRILKCQLQSLGKLRDHHVFQVFVEERANKFVGLSLLRRHLERGEDNLLKAASRQIDGFKIKKLQKWIGAVIADLAQNANMPPDQDPLVAVALRCAGEAFAETVERLKLIDFNDLRTIHRTRVAFKKFRYLVEVLPPEVSGFSKRELRSLAYYQRRMGSIQDLEVIGKGLAEFVGHNKNLESVLHPFCAYLRRHRARTLRSFRKSIDHLFEFWPRRKSPALFQPLGLPAVPALPTDKSCAPIGSPVS